MSLFIRTFALLTSLMQYGGIGSYVNIDLKSENESSLKNLIVFLYFFKSILKTHISSILLYNVLYNVSLCFLFAKKYNLPIRIVIQPEGQNMKEEDMTEAFDEKGVFAAKL